MNRPFPSNNNNFVIQFSGNSSVNQDHNPIRGFSQEPQKDQCYPIKHNSNFFEDKLNLHKQKRSKKQKAFHWTGQENYDYQIFCTRHFDLLKNPDKNQRKQKKVFKEMAKEIKTRTDRQCRSHHQKAFPLLCQHLEENCERSQEEQDNESDGIESSTQTEQDSQNQQKYQLLQQYSDYLTPQQFHFGNHQLNQPMQTQDFIDILQKLIQSLKLEPQFLERRMHVLYACQEKLPQKSQCQSQFDIHEDYESPNTQIARNINSLNDHNEQNRDPEQFNEILNRQNQFYNTPTTSMGFQNEESEVEFLGNGEDSNQIEKTSVKKVPIKKSIKKSKSSPSKKRH